MNEEQKSYIVKKIEQYNQESDKIDKSLGINCMILGFSTILALKGEMLGYNNIIGYVAPLVGVGSLIGVGIDTINKLFKIQNLHSAAERLECKLKIDKLESTEVVEKPKIYSKGNKQ